MPSRGRRWAWYALFSGLLLLSLDYWRWDDGVRIGAFGLPTWLWYFVGLQVLMAGGIAAFARRDWGNDGASSPDDRPAP